ncbi:MAG: response regulator transcription factor [Polyangiaceae bacterium]|nr:response regulator transcription factor [Polyangiaceae bacterium]
MIRVIVVDDHALVRAGLCRLFVGERDIELVGQGGTGREAVQLCRQLKPDVAVLDYRLPDLDGLETTTQLVGLSLGVRVLIVTMYGSEEYATRVMRVGAAGFVVKSALPTEFLAAIRKVAQNGVYVSPGVMEKMMGRMAQNLEKPPESELTNRELQVLIQLSRGSTTREVSKAMGLSVSTVETYRKRLMDKLGLRNNSDMTRFAVRRGLIEVE